MKVQFVSLFFSVVRTILTVFFGGWGLVLLLFSISLVTSSIGGNSPVRTTSFQIEPNLEWKRTPLKETSPLIIQMNLDGIIGVDIQPEDILHPLVDLQTSNLKKDRVKAIFLYINSPGGLATTSENIYQALQEYKQKFQIPIYAFVDNLCASGGMYIACAADKIFATRKSLIGSVGVRNGPFFNYVNTLDFLGVKAKTLTKGKNKDTFNPYRTWKENEGVEMENSIQQAYELFLDTVIKARPAMTYEKLVNEYGAGVFMGKEALEKGYVDEIVDHYFSAISMIAKELDLDPENCQVLSVSEERGMLQKLAGGSSKSSLRDICIMTIMGKDQYVFSQFQGKTLFLYQ